MKTKNEKKKLRIFFMSEMRSPKAAFKGHQYHCISIHANIRARLWWEENLRANVAPRQPIKSLFVNPEVVSRLMQGGLLLVFTSAQSDAPGL